MMIGCESLRSGLCASFGRGALTRKARSKPWHAEALKASWRSPQEIKTQFRSASILKAGRVVFNIGGNKYRLVVAIDYARQTCFVKFVGTHREYDSIDAETVNYENPPDSN